MIDACINEMRGDEDCEKYSDGGGSVKIVYGMLMNVLWMRKKWEGKWNEMNWIAVVL